MKKGDKVVYVAPKAAALHLAPEGLVCESTSMVVFLLDGAPGTEINYGRESYGSAEVETWN